ncbi:MAG: hypothetical protein FWF22_11230 [Treponema sp.]|nr:hypothetical protein [Treponema sp.]
MKRTILLLVFIGCAIALVSAQDGQRRGQGRFPGGQNHGQEYEYGRERSIPRDRSAPQLPKPESVSISGNLVIVSGRIAVNSGDVTYFVGGLNRFIGFIEGLKEGASVKLEGNAFSLPQNEKLKFLAVQKMTLNSREYDIGGFRQAAPNQMHQRNQLPMNRQSPGCDCRNPPHSKMNKR